MMYLGLGSRSTLEVADHPYGSRVTIRDGEGKHTLVVPFKFAEGVPCIPSNDPYGLGDAQYPDDETDSETGGIV